MMIDLPADVSSDDDAKASLDPIPFRLRDVHRQARQKLQPLRRSVRAANRKAFLQAGYPVGHRNLAASLGSASDATILGLARLIIGDVNGGRRAAIAAEAREALAVHTSAGWTRQPATYHQAPEVPSSISTRRHDDWEFLSYESRFAPPSAEPGADRWLARLENRTALLRVRRVPRDRPWLVLVHGAGMGAMRTDVPILDPVRLGAELDVNIVMPVLPLHGPRRTPGPLVKSVLPSLDILDTLHGLAQAIYDVRCALAWIRDQTTAPVALYGISLGGFTVASVAALEPALAAVVAGVPLVDITGALYSRAAPRQQGAPWFNSYVDVSNRLLSVLSPLALPSPATPRERLNIYAGRVDRFVPALDHAVALAKQWGDVPIYWLRGSHTSHLRSRQVRRFVQSTLATNLDFRGS